MIVRCLLTIVLAIGVYWWGFHDGREAERNDTRKAPVE